jgi:antitoxin VapB
VERKTVLQLAPETERLARQVAAHVGRDPDALIRATLQREAKALGIPGAPAHERKMTSAEMLAFGRRIAARPVLDPRSADEIANDLNAL